MSATVDWSHLAAWLLGRGDAPSIAALRATRLGAYAYAVLPSSNPDRARLRADYIAALGRHQRLKAALRPLLHAWRANGIDVLLFKGFQLSEFVYPWPGERFHGDVDVLLRLESVQRAEEIAAKLGWNAAVPAPLRGLRNHMAFSLDDKRGGVRVDVHQQILHVLLPWHPTQRRITTAVWTSSRSRLWQGIEIREPAPVDMLLVGLVLQRCWGAERWQLKPHDVLDFRLISSRHNVTREELWERARALNCERTLAAFLDRCDPDAGHLDLSPVDARRRWRLDRAAFAERGPLGGAERALLRGLYWPLASGTALRFTPEVLRVRRALRKHQDLHSLLRALTAKQPRFRVDPRAQIQWRSLEERATIVSAVGWAMRLVGHGRFGPCLVRALATYIALRDRGWPVEFVSGIRRDGKTAVGHAWVEVDGAVLLELDPTGCARFEENFRYPARARVRTAFVPRSDAPTAAATRDPERVPQTHRGSSDRPEVPRSPTTHA